MADHSGGLRCSAVACEAARTPVAEQAKRKRQPAPAPRQTAQTEAPEGYREAIAAHRATPARQQHTRPETQAAAEHQLRDRIREPEDRFADGRQALEELRARAAAQQQALPSDVSRARALQRLGLVRPIM
ncbi:hypothetical protein [Streptomyces californicus]|uniref:hypothetical protein n=1 Tax=Streptomyces californicus TaxID=67351 RepID=UPI0033E7CA1E